jgi:ribonuclease D
MIKYEISREELQNYPSGHYEGEIKIISDANQIDSVCKLLTKETVLGVDCETKPAFKKGVFHPVSLIQIASSDIVYLIRINHTGFTDSVISLLQDKNIIKAGVDLHNDMRELNKIRSFNPENIIDLNHLAKEKGFLSTGAKKLTALLLGFRISKRMQTSNWENEVLSESQIIYAATDAWISREIYFYLMSIHQ